MEILEIKSALSTDELIILFSHSWAIWFTKLTCDWVKWKCGWVVRIPLFCLEGTRAESKDLYRVDRFFLGGSTFRWPQSAQLWFLLFLWSSSLYPSMLHCWCALSQSSFGDEPQLRFARWNFHNFYRFGMFVNGWGSTTATIFYVVIEEIIYIFIHDEVENVEK